MKVVKFLLVHDANARLTNCAGQTALTIAQTANHKEPLRQELLRALQREK